MGNRWGGEWGRRRVRLWEKGEKEWRWEGTIGSICDHGRVWILRVLWSQLFVDISEEKPGTKLLNNTFSVICRYLRGETRYEAFK